MYEETTIEVGGVISFLSKLETLVDKATEGCAKMMVEKMESLAEKTAPVGTPGNSTAPPGKLASSMKITGPVGTDHVWRAKVGPTTKYGRQRELGGVIVPVRAKALVFHRFGVLVVTTRVFQHGEHYMKKARDLGIAELPALTQAYFEKVLAPFLG